MRRLHLCILIAFICSDALAEQTAASSAAALGNPNAGNCAPTISIAIPLAEKGNAEAQLFLGACYGNRNGNKRKSGKYKQESAKWYRMAAEQGNAAGQFQYGEMFAAGDSVPQDYASAIKWLRLSAIQGNADAQSALAQIYKDGRGVPKDLVLAYMWAYIAATTQGENNESGKQAIIKQKIIGIIAGMTDDQVLEARELIRKCTTEKLKGC